MTARLLHKVSTIKRLGLRFVCEKILTAQIQHVPVDRSSPRQKHGGLPGDNESVMYVHIANVSYLWDYCGNVMPVQTAA